MEQPVRIGIIGVGQIGTRHLEAYREIREARIVAVSDLFPERLEAALRKLEGAAAVPNFCDLLKRDDIDAVDVCVHNNKHAPITIEALKAGKHVYCEKPMAGAYRDAEEMLHTSRETDRRLHIQLANLYSAETRAARRIIEEGHLGKIYYARSFGYRRRGRPFVDGYGSPSFVDKAISAGGAMFDMGVYHLTQLLHLMGNPEVVSVTGAVHQELDMYDDRRAFSGYSVEEMGLGWARLAGGISFDIEETWAGHQDGQESSKLLGSRGGLRLNPLSYFSTLGDLEMNATFDVGAADRRWHSCDPNTAWYDSSQRHWIGALLGRVPLLPTAEYALNASLISEGIYLSSQAARELTAEQIRARSVSTAIDPETPERTIQ